MMFIGVKTEALEGCELGVGWERSWLLTRGLPLAPAEVMGVLLRLA